VNFTELKQEVVQKLVNRLVLVQTWCRVIKGKKEENRSGSDRGFIS